MIAKTDLLDKSRDVAIVGLGLRLPGSSNTPSQLWENLIDGFDGIIETRDRWADTFADTGEISSKYAGLLDFEEWINFDPLFFGINPSEAKEIDPQQKLLLKATWEAFEDAQIDPLSLKGSADTSVFIGASSMEYAAVTTDPLKPTVNCFNVNLSGVSNRISYCFDLRGTSLTVDSACSSSLNAVHLGYESILNGSTYSIVGGVNFIINPQQSRSFTSVNVIGKTGRCKTFDETADGFVRSEGAVVLILKNLSNAIKDGNQIYAVIKGSSSNVDGTLNKTNYFAPSKTSQANNISKAFDSTKGQLLKSDIDFFELHGTGTQVGDPIEVEAVATLFQDIKSNENPLLIGSIKSNIGHLEPASGVASLAKVCLMFKHRQFVKNIHFNKPNPNIKFEEWKVKVCTENIPFPNKSVSIAINSFGITGSNACLLLTEYKKPESAPITTTKNKTYLMPISSSSKKSLEQYRSKLINQVDSYSQSVSFQDFIQYHICSKATKLASRSVLTAKDWSDINQSKINESFISTKNNRSGNIIKDNNKNPTLVFVYCGLGPQWNQTGKNLYENEPVFKNSMDRIDQIFTKLFGYSVLKKLRSIKDDDSVAINDFAISQPTIFMVQVSLFEFYKSWGINPSINVGHSFGEISSAYCSEMIDLETACFIIYKRVTLQSKTMGSGKMLVIGLNEKDFTNKYQAQYPLVEISCYNSPSSVVISGSEQDLTNISASLKEKEVFSVLLGAPSALHSSKQATIKDEILDQLKDIKFKPPTIKTFSTVTTNLFNKSTAFDSNYIYSNLRKPVLFEKTISNIFTHIENNDLGSTVIFLELSPNPTLTHYINEMIPKESNYFYSDDNAISVLSSLNKKKPNEVQEIQSTIANLYCNGYNVNFNCQLFGNPKDFTSYFLPRYQWDDSDYFKHGRVSKQIKQGPTIDQLGYRVDESPFMSYTTYIDIKEEPYQFLKGHQSRGRYLFPANGYLDNVLKAFPHQDLTFHLMEYRSPLILKEGVKQLISTNIYPSSKNEYRVTFHFKDAFGKWILSCAGRFSVVKHNSDLQNQKINVQELKDKCNWTTIKKNEFYEGLKVRTALSLSGKFQSIEEAYYGYNCCLAKISLSDRTTLSSYDNESFLNICTIDGGFQLLGLFINPDVVVLDKVELLRFYADNIPKSASFRETHKYIYSYTEYISKIGNSVYANITTFLPDGTLLFNAPVVCFTGFSSIRGDISIENPDHQLYSACLQSIESPLSVDTPGAAIDSALFTQFVPKPVANIRNAFTTCIFANIKKKYQSITPALINTSTIQFLIDSYFKISENDTSAKKNLGISLFESLKKNWELIKYSDQAKLLKLLPAQQQEIMNKITKILLNETIPETNDTANLIGKLTPNPSQTLLINEIISKSITPLVNQRILFRIIEIGCGIGQLSEMIVSKINLLLQQNPLAEIDIELTFTDSQDISFVKEKLTTLVHSVPEVDNSKDLSSRKPSLLFKVLDINEKDLIQSKSITPSYYDIVVLNNLVGINNLNETVNLIYQILNPNGYLLLVDTLFKPATINSEFELYQQWLSYNYMGSTKDIESWKKLLTQDFNLINFTATSSEPWLILVQKPKFIETVSKENPISYTIGLYDQVVIYGTVENVNEAKAMSKLMDVNDKGTDIYFIRNIDDFDTHVKETPLSDKSVIVFVNTINNILLDFYTVSIDYIKINQYLLKKECSAKHVLLTRNVFLESSNPLASAVVGAFRYFCEFPQLNLYLMDFDDGIYVKSSNFINITHELTDPNKHYQREFIFRDSQVSYERVTQETNLKLKYKSDSYISEPEGLYAKLNQNLQYQLKAFEPVPPLHVEIQVLASGINFKDNLVYRRLVPPEAVNHTGDASDPEFGYECSGIVSRIGEGVTKFKVGDEVVGLGFNCTGSYVTLEQFRFVPKPKNLTHVEAASIPVVYLTSYYSLFVAGYLSIEKKESVLIHGATGGIGLACLNLLKAKGFQGLLFVTVGSKEKENFLRVTYGNFITGIYSSKNTDYLFEIKKKIQQVTGNDLIFKQFGVAKMGVDLIINTLPSEFMDANFNSLCQGGRLVDLSVTHMNSQDTTDFRKFRYCIQYSTVELLLNGFERNRLILQEIMDMFVNENLKLLPIKEYPVSEIKEAIEFIQERKHIGKLVVNHENQGLMESIFINNDYEFYKDYLIPKPNYKISNNCNLGKTVLITGQTGLSLAIIKWIIALNSEDQPVENIIVFSKSPIKYELEHMICYCKHMNLKVKIIYEQVDVSDLGEINEKVDSIYSKNPDLPIVSSIFHNAFVPSECDPLEIDMDHLLKSHSGKTLGLINLHSLSTGIWAESVKNFVISSSITSILGSQRQCGYISANCVIDAFSRLRSSQGLPCTSINWGVLATGFVSRNEGVSKLFEYQGFTPISVDMVNGTLDLFLQNPDKLNGKIVASFNYNNVSVAFKDHCLAYKLNYFLNPVYTKGSTFDDSEASIRDDILEKFSEYLSTEKSKLSLETKLIDYGASSMLLVELKNYLDKKYTPNILSIAQLQNVTINQLINAVIQAVSKLKKKPSKKSNEDLEAPINWEDEIHLDPTIKPTPQMIESFKKSIDKVYKNNTDGGLEVLLTGPCTFMGLNLLFNLLTSPKTKLIHCMMPLNSEEEVLKAINDGFKNNSYDILLKTENLAKIKPIAADFTRPLFGLTGTDYIEFSKKINLVINAASNTTKHYCAHINYQDTNKEYLQGVSHLLRFACTEKIKRVVQISTLGRYSDTQRETLNEYDFPEVDFSFISGQNQLVSGYIQSKIVAEYHLKQAADRGIPCFIIRIPFCFPGENGVGREADFTQLLLQSCYVLKSYPTESHVQIYTAPVTWYAKNIITMTVGSNITIDGCWNDIESSPIENLICANLFGGGFNFGDLLVELSKDLSWKGIPFETLVKKAAINEHDSCKKLASFVLKKKGDFIKNLGVIPGHYNINENLKNLLALNNSFEGWLITKQLIYNHLSYVFKKKIN
ncbi:hypothetical protein DICPUDRAFT_153779 [Dictyostelium purpureum]|uniref:Uncharacterized protein n=1 Tax=Dictyostelium purpureum TaxID=5786 RepID=F0ZPQ7_DICPU|nr:uncharacterized protein DICPUDRAFT_153779 [Dictyostelium purpureum]EGC34076.1 hypothetical protein DICPUDRAFT_153779 [Dictyostelium purpureum]|eukprot:XP_003289406.1 hypothetical protein DICPUDRAFT_153779 [Dictyostelium purpureum]